MERKPFKVNDIPFEDLKDLGVSKEALLDLPKNALSALLAGRKSPLLTLRCENNEGSRLNIPAKIAFIRDDEGKVNVEIFPRRKELDNALNLTEEEIGLVKAGKTIKTMKDNEEILVEYDKEINALVSAKAKDIHIPSAIGEVLIGGEQQERLRNGEPLEIEIGDTKVTIGVDLNDRTGFKVLKGDLNEWREKKLIEWDRITPGATGYWITSENGWQYQRIEDERERGGKRESEENRYGGIKKGMGFNW